MKTAKRIRTLLYGDQRLSRSELEVLHTPSMQRLYDLKQLGLTDRVFIDASHARIHHVVGVLQQVDKLVSAIVNNLTQSTRTLGIGSSGVLKEQRTISAKQLARFVQERRPVIRFIGLLHDLTHAPFGHTVEDEIRLVGSKHDDPERQADAFYRLLCQLVAWFLVEAEGPNSEHFPEQLRPFLSHGAQAKLPDACQVGSHARRLLCGKERQPWRLSRQEMASLFAQLGCAMTALLHLQPLYKKKLMEQDLPKEAEYEFQTAIRTALYETAFAPLFRQFEFRPNRDAFMLDIVGNTVCADLLDYAKRDSLFAGLRLDYDSDRIAENFTLVSLDASAYELSHSQDNAESSSGESRVPKGRSDPFAGWCLRTAISLVSHKYRIDIPSELMNLLNVRFYLYERAIYHPTKCAAGSMLGTALQLLGWRGPGTGDILPTLPDHLRYVGDDVFLHDIRAALDFVLHWIDELPGQSIIEAKQITGIAYVDRLHNGLVPALLTMRVGQTVNQVQPELLAARLLLDRLMARRYYRPVFRALPNSKDTRLQASAETLADVFREPDTRFDVERRIERQSQLPLGTITIHCPVRTTARKIANVLLTKPGLDGEDEVCKLQDIGSLDGPTFGEHQKAVKAVEQMYGSMWRLTVYVAPEHLHQYAEISKIVGQVIFETIDVHDQFADRPEISWENDPHLVRELETTLIGRLDGQQGVEEGPNSLSDLADQLTDQLFASDALTDIPPGLIRSIQGSSADLRPRVKQALLMALSGASVVSQVKPAAVGPTDRTDRLVAVFRTHVKKPKRQDIDDFRSRYAEPLSRLEPEAYEEILSQLQAGILETQKLDHTAATVHSGYKFRTLVEAFDDLLRKHGVSLPATVNKNLFEGGS